MSLEIPTDRGSSLSPAHRRAIETFYGALDSGGFDSLDAALTPDWEDVPLAPGEEPGPAGLKSIFTMLRTAIPDISVEIVDVVGEGDKVACRVSVCGTHKGPLFGVPASGKSVRFALHEFHDFSGDRIRRTFHQEDLFGLFEQIGQFPTPGRDR